MLLGGDSRGGRVDSELFGRLVNSRAKVEEGSVGEFFRRRANHERMSHGREIMRVRLQLVGREAGRNYFCFSVRKSVVMLCAFARRS